MLMEMLQIAHNKPIRFLKPNRFIIETKSRTESTEVIQALLLV